MIFSEAILYIGLAQTLFAAFALGTRRKVTMPDIFLIGSLLAFAFKFVIIIFHNQHREFFDMQFSLALIPLTFGPYLYLYTTYLIEGKRRFNPTDLLHFVPFLSITFIYLIFFQDVVDFSDQNYLNNDEYLWVRVSFSGVFFTSVITYIVLTFVKLSVFRKNIDSQFSYHSRKLRLMWLNFIAILFSLNGLVVIIAGGYNALKFEAVIDTTMLSNIGLTVIAYSISYFGLRQPSLFRQNHADSTSEESNISVGNTDEKTIKPRFSPKEALELKERLISLMNEERPYLNAELTLGELSGQVNLAKHELTDLLNVHINKNFFSFVNEFRLNAVIRRLGNPDFDHLTIIAIANDCGFNSKSTFNSLFKQHTGHTPSDYKKNLRES